MHRASRAAHTGRARLALGPQDSQDRETVAQALPVEQNVREQGNDGYNLDLSNRRAATVMRYLREQGIDAERLASKGYGETLPVDRAHTQAAYKLNRRVAFIIQKRDQ